MKKVTKDHILPDSIYMKYLVRQIYREKKCIRGCLGLRMRMRNDCNGHKGPFWHNENVIKLDGGEGSTIL